jgi:hypothetical protein
MFVGQWFVVAARVGANGNGYVAIFKCIVLLRTVEGSSNIAMH